MKKNILMLFLLIGVSGFAFAQTSDSFPEFDLPFADEEPENGNLDSLNPNDGDIQEVEPEERIEEIPENDGVNEEVSDELWALAAGVDFESEVGLEELEEVVEEETEEEKDRKIYFALNDIQNNLVAVREVSFCSAHFVLYNDTKRTVNEISGSIKIGDHEEKFKFSGVAPAKAVGLPVQIIGKSCEEIMNIPTLNLKVCKVERMSEKNCRTKLIYVPIE